MMWLIKPKTCNNNQYYADNNLGKRSKEQYCWIRNKEQYLGTLSEGHRFWVGLLASVHCTFQVHPLLRATSRLSPQYPGREGRGEVLWVEGGQVPAPYGPSRVHHCNTLISLE